VTLKGRDYLEVKWRLVWLRTEHPEATIATELVRLDEEKGFALFRAAVGLPDGGPYAVITNMGILYFDDRTKEMYLGDRKSVV